MKLSTMVACLLIVEATSFPASAQRSPAFASGADDRASYESWFASLTGQFQAGVEFWATHQSGSLDATCYGPSAMPITQWLSGCLMAQHRFETWDKRRKAEPDYRSGWNSLGNASDRAPPQLRSVSPADLGQSATKPPSQWTFVEGNASDVMAHYVDRIGIVRTGQTATMWTLQDVRPVYAPDGTAYVNGRFLSVKYKMEYDCLLDQNRGIFFGSYTGHMGNGATVDEHTETGPWKRVADGERPDWNVACRY